MRVRLNGFPYYLLQVEDNTFMGPRRRLFCSTYHYYAPPFLRVGFLLLLYVALDRGLLRLTKMPADSFEQPFLWGAWIGHLGLLKGGGLLLGVIGLLVVAHRRDHLCWTSFQHGLPLRRLALILAVILTWAYTTYDYNLYYGHAYAIDRILLLALLPLIYWRPAFILPFLLVLLPVLQQFFHPLGGYAWTVPLLPIRILMLLSAAWLFSLLTGRLKTDDLIFLLCVLIASQYWASGWGKIQLDWMRHAHIAYLLPATYANGWLSFLHPDTIGRLTHTLSRLNEPMKAFTLLVECGALFCLWRRTALHFFLLAWIAFHAAIFFTTGICFWKWVVVDAAVLLLFFRKDGKVIPAIFTRPYFLLSVMLIASAPLWAKPRQLAWYDVRLNYTYRLEAVASSGRATWLAPHFFGPYTYPFTLSNFGYLSRSPHLGVTWGVTRDKALAEALSQATTPAQVFALERARGRSTFHPERSVAFDAFIQRFIGRWNESRSKRTWWHPIQSPPQLWTFPHRVSLEDSSPIQRVHVYQVTSLYDGLEYREIRTRLVRCIDIPASATYSK